MPEKSLQVTRLRLVTWKDFSGIRDLQKPVLALPPHSIGSMYSKNGKCLTKFMYVRLTLIHMAYFWPIFAQGTTQLLMVRFSKFFFCLKDLQKFLLKIDDRTS